MPELPEVETTRRGITPHVLNSTISSLILKRSDLRLPIPPSIQEIAGHSISSIERRSKYLIFHLTSGASLIIHLGMSGSLRITHPSELWKKHDHVAICLSNGNQLRFHDPRRFGLILHTTHPPDQHPLLAKLGPEPLSPDFNLKTFSLACRKRNTPIKTTLMDSKIVVGVGNIYASEALFSAGILPQTPASNLQLKQLKKLIPAIQFILKKSIEQGGTTLRDFINADGKPGYFKQNLMVYGRSGQPCQICKTPIQQQLLSQRSTFWCPRCQK